MEVGRPPKLIQACCCLAPSETLVTYGYVVSFGHMFWMCVVDVCFGRAVRKVIFARPARRRGQDGPRRPLGSATNRVEENERKSGAIAWEVREKCPSRSYEVQKREAKNSDLAQEVLEKLTCKRF